MATIDTYVVATGEFTLLDEAKVFEDRMEGVYFVQSFFNPEAPVKIGCAKNIGRRYDALQTANYEELCIRLICKTTAGKRFERMFHEHFAHLKVRGEWFEKDEELARFIDYPDRAFPELVKGEPLA